MPKPKPKIILKTLILDLGLLEEKQILPFIMAGEIFVNGQRADSPFVKVNYDSKIEIRSKISKYVGRGGYKLEAALEKFKIKVSGLVCVDFGACTGGFVDVLLQSGAKKVIAVEKGLNQLDGKLLEDSRVENYQGVSLFELNSFAKNIDLAVCDLSFIPLKKAIPKIFELTNSAPLVALLKPHYEIADETKLEGGIIKDTKIRQEVIQDFQTWLKANGYILENFMQSPIKGGGGNIEYLTYIKKSFN